MCAKCVHYFYFFFSFHSISLRINAALRDCVCECLRIASKKLTTYHRHGIVETVRSFCFTPMQLYDAMSTHSSFLLILYFVGSSIKSNAISFPLRFEIANFSFINLIKRSLRAIFTLSRGFLSISFDRSVDEQLKACRQV